MRDGTKDEVVDTGEQGFGGDALPDQQLGADFEQGGGGHRVGTDAALGQRLDDGDFLAWR